MSKVSEYLEPHIYFPMDFPTPDEPGEGDCSHEIVLAEKIEDESLLICNGCGQDLTEEIIG